MAPLPGATDVVDPRECRWWTRVTAPLLEEVSHDYLHESSGNSSCLAVSEPAVRASVEGPEQLRDLVHPDHASVHGMHRIKTRDVAEAVSSIAWSYLWRCQNTIAHSQFDAIVDLQPAGRPSAISARGTVHRARRVVIAYVSFLATAPPIATSLFGKSAGPASKRPA